MAYTGPTEDIILQEGTFAFDFECSGSVTGGQAVEAVRRTAGEIAVRAIPNASLIGHGCVGVAAYDQTDGKAVAVYGPGNICRVIISGTTNNPGDVLHATYDGQWHHTDFDYYCSGVNAVMLDQQATHAATTKVMLF